MTEYFKSEDITKLKEAVGILAMWRARMGDGLHVAAEMTELLLRAIILDKETDIRDWFNAGYLRIVYSTVIIRIINYASEIGQCTTPHYQTVVSAVRKLGIPSWVVQVRHASAHQFLPSIELFRKAAKFCRDWLWNFHWGRPIKEAMDIAMVKETVTPCENAVNLIVSYIMFRMENPKKKFDEQELLTEGILGDIYKFLSTDSSNFVRAFLFDGHLIMTAEQMKIAGFSVNDGNEVWLIPPSLQLFWEPVLRLFTHLNLLPELLCQLIMLLDFAKVNEAKERQLVAWADYMLAAFSKTDSVSQADWKRIMKVMLSVRILFRSEHYEMVMDKINLLSLKKRKQLRRLLDLSLDSSQLHNSSSLMENGSGVKTLEELRELIDAGIGGVNTEDPITGEDNWITCDPSQWRGVALGLTPEQSAESLFLILDKDYA